MNYRTFGRTGWPVSEIGYGMWGMAGWTGSDDNQSARALKLAVELGCNFFDTAWAYGNGHSERLLGQLIRAFPDRHLYTASKVPPKNRAWPSRRHHTLDDCYPPEYVRRYIEHSLSNTGLETLDLMQLHTWEDAWLADDRWVQELDRAKTAGKIGAVGISVNRWEPWNGVAAVRSGLVDSVQVIYNIFDQNPQDDLFPACREHQVAVIARVPFDEGTLTGKLTLESIWPEGDWRNTYFVEENLRSSIARAEPLKELVPPDSTMAAMALRFILDEAVVSTVIPGMRKLRHVRANMAASQAGRLEAALIRQLCQHRWDRMPTEWSQ
ncbi:MAG: aldo/keto reductase [Bacteroidota bacterium]|nr:aldo/keto reductase [Bacteroidota bacterium]MDE2955877.1 aldo/keto reductase [Bacteroidota bacterium]